MSDWSVDRKLYGKSAWLLQPAVWAVGVYRFGRWTLGAPMPVRSFVHVLYFGMYSIVRLLTGIDIPRTAGIGPGLLIHHFGTVIVHPRANIGAYCTLRHGVTIGVRFDDGEPPRIGSRVSIGAHVQILGDIEIGEGALIGAMSLVISDVPPGATVGGVPAKILKTRPE